MEKRIITIIQDAVSSCVKIEKEAGKLAIDGENPLAGMVKEAETAAKKLNLMIYDIGVNDFERVQATNNDFTRTCSLMEKEVIDAQKKTNQFFQTLLSEIKTCRDRSELIAYKVKEADDLSIVNGVVDDGEIVVND